MFRRIRSRRVVILPIIAALLCILLSAFTFSQLNAMRSTITAGSHSVSLVPNKECKPSKAHPCNPIVSATKRPKRTPTVGTTPTYGATPTIGVTPTSTVGTTPTVETTATVGTTPTVTGAQTVQVFVEPNAGEQVILNAVNNAHQSVWLEIYLLSDKNVIQALKNAAGRKLDVRVMLEPHPYGGGSPTSTISDLQSAGVKAQTSNPAFSLTHEKGMIIDGNTAFIMTSNFTFSALNGKNREYGIIDTTPQDVQGTIDIFTADWNRSSVQVSDPNLVVSPDNSRNNLTAFINSAKSSLIVEAEEMLDSGIEQALVSAEQHGVNVQVVLPTPQSGTDANAGGIATIKAGGVQVKEDPQLVMHAKMMVADGTRAYVGSENFSSNSLDQNRELGVLVTDITVIGTLQQTFQQDWSISQSQDFWGW